MESQKQERKRKKMLKRLRRLHTAQFSTELSLLELLCKIRILKMILTSKIMEAHEDKIK